MSDPRYVCRLCKQPVEKLRDYYEVQEQMHWLCFHIIFEHTGDPDEACEDPSCPWRRIDDLNRRLKEAGLPADD